VAGKEKEERSRRIKGKRCVVSLDISRREIGDDLFCRLIAGKRRFKFIALFGLKRGQGIFFT